MVSNERFLPKKWALKWLSSTIKKYELAILKKIDGFMAISSVDFDFFINETQTSGKVIPFGIDVDHGVDQFFAGFVDIFNKFFQSFC